MQSSWTCLLVAAATVLMCEPSRAQSLVVNGGFENGTALWYCTGTLTTVTTGVHAGDASGFATIPAYGTLGHDMFDYLQPGHTYNWSAWLRAPSGAPSVTVWLGQTDTGGSASTLLATITLPFMWSQYSGSFTLNVSGTLSAASLWMQAGNSLLSLYLDDVTVTDAALSGVTGQGTATFSLENPRPNPARGDRLAVSFSLPTSEPAHMELLDVGGRRVADREVGVLGAGQHTVTFDNARPVPAGLYFVRLQQGPNARTIRVAVLD
jgi:hypothetical protein